MHPHVPYTQKIRTKSSVYKGRQTVGSNPTNSRFLQSRVTNGANCPFSAEYVWGGDSNLALASRLHRPHFHTKLAIPPLPPATSYSSTRLILIIFGWTSLHCVHLTLGGSSCEQNAVECCGRVQTSKQYSKSSPGRRSVTFSRSALIDNSSL